MGPAAPYADSELTPELPPAWGEVARAAADPWDKCCQWHLFAIFFIGIF